MQALCTCLIFFYAGFAKRFRPSEKSPRRFFNTFFSGSEFDGEMPPLVRLLNAPPDVMPAISVEFCSSLQQQRR